MVKKVIKTKRKMRKPRRKSAQKKGYQGASDGSILQKETIFVAIIAVIITIITFFAVALLRPLTVHGVQIEQLRKDNIALTAENKRLNRELEVFKSRLIKLEIQLEFMRVKDKLTLAPGEPLLGSNIICDEQLVDKTFEPDPPTRLNKSRLQCNGRKIRDVGAVKKHEIVSLLRSSQ